MIKLTGIIILSIELICCTFAFKLWCKKQIRNYKKEMEKLKEELLKEIN